MNLLRSRTSVYRLLLHLEATQCECPVRYGDRTCRVLTGSADSGKMEAASFLGRRECTAC